MLSERKYREFLKDLDDRAQARVVAIYEEADRLLQERMRKTLEKELTQKAVDQTVSFNEQVIRAALGQTKAEIENGVREAYMAGGEYTNSFAPRGADIGFTFEKLSESSKAQVTALMQKSYLDFAQTLQVVVNSSRKGLSEALRRQIRDRIAVGVLLGDGIETIARDIERQILTPKGFTGLIKSNGARMSLRDYARTTARSMIITSANEGTQSRMGELGITIWQVSSHSGGTEDEACADHQGKIYDMTGKKYPKPEESDYPPYHPNCRHIRQPRPDLQY
jgi:hypothetical protein